uniref:Initiator Rep protein WH1 domain-containing protein n=1 Tax=uncultured prokaryote TaxID=198431 RepID=A0A0H5Q2A0_9ZZZZ|nr:hypothetical protein [uncultured prokaryote]
MNNTQEIENRIHTNANKLIQNSMNTMSAKEQKLLCVLLSEYFKNYNEDNLCVTTTLTRTAFLNYLGINKGGSSYTYLNTVLEDFATHSWIKWTDEEHNNEIVPYFSKIRYNTDENGTDEVVFTWNLEMKPYLVGLEDNFTELYTRNILALNSPREITLYKLMKSYAGRNIPPTLTVEELRKLLDCTKSYPDTRIFYRDAIKRPIDNINKKTDLSIEIIKNPTKKNKLVAESYTFKIKDKSKKRSWWTEFPLVKLTEEEYTTLSDLKDNNLKFYVRQLNDMLEEGKPFRNHFLQILKYQQAGRCDMRYIQENRQKSKQSICQLQSGKISRQPSYDLEQIKFDAMNNTEIK